MHDQAAGRKDAAHAADAVDHGDRDDEHDDAEDACPAREQAEHEAQPDGELQVYGHGREDLRAREVVFGEERREFLHARGSR